MPLGDVSSEQLGNAYKKEIDLKVKERILLVIRVRIDGQQASKVAEKQNCTNQGGRGIQVVRPI